MPAKLCISKNDLKDNVEYVKSLLNSSTKIIAIVKANAYGCGITEITKYLLSLGINDFGVALVKEGVYLRTNGILSNILVTSQFLPEDIADIINYDLSVSVSNMELLNKLNAEAKVKNKTVKVHIKIDTGMGRLGFNKDTIFEDIKEIKKNFNNIVLDGIYTHLACADSDEEYTLKQLNDFNFIVNKLKSLGFSFNYIHALNSYGILKYSKYQFSHVRPGIILYGYLNDDYNQYVKPILTLKAPILRIFETKYDTKIGYNGNYIAKKGSKIATISIGYADGLPRSISNIYDIHIGNKTAKIVGNICMDMCMIDITNIEKKLNVGDFITIIRNNEDIQKIARISNTIDYEIISKFSSRLDRTLI